MVSNEKLHVLIVEEKADDLRLLKDFIFSQFANAVISHVSALEHARQHLDNRLSIDAILIDLSAGGLFSQQQLTEIVRLASTVPVIVLSNKKDKDIAIKTLSLGVSDYLLKEELSAVQLHKSITYSIERRKINLKLNESEDKYRRLFNFSPLPQWVFDAQTLEFLDVNEAAIRHYGYTRDEFLSMKISDIRPGEDIEILMNVLNSGTNGGFFTSKIVRHLKKSGELIYVNIEGNIISFEGRDARLTLIVDITEKMKAERALKSSEQRFRALVQEGTDLICILDRQGNYKYVSPTTKSILNIPAEDFLGKNAFDFIFEDDKPHIISQFGALACQKRIEISPYRFLDGHMRYRWIETVLTDLTDDPAVGGIVANSRDVTLRIENENKIKENIERYNSVSKATSDAIYEWDYSTNIVQWNQGLQEIFGHQIEQSSFDWWYQHVHPDDADRIASDVQQFISNRESRWKGEYRFRCTDGSYRFVMDRSLLDYNEAGVPVRMIGSIQDITERVKYIQAIEDQNARLREISWIQSHVVRAPLARIMGLIDLLKNYGHDDEGKKEIMEYLLISANELDDVIKSIINRTEQVDGTDRNPV